MRWLTVRVLGTDLFEIGIGREEPDEETVEPDVPPMTNVVGNGGSPALDAPLQFGVHPATPLGDPSTQPEWRGRR